MASLRSDDLEQKKTLLIGSIQQAPDRAYGLDDDGRLHERLGDSTVFTRGSMHSFEVETDAGSVMTAHANQFHADHLLAGYNNSGPGRGRPRAWCPRLTCCTRARVLQFLWDYHFLIGLICLSIIGAFWPTPGEAIDTPATSYVCPAIVFFIAGLYLNTKELKQALRDWPAVLFGLVTILVIVPCFAFAVPSMNIRPVEFSRGFIVYMTVPTALGTITMLTELAHGNATLATLFGVMTNLLGTITAPLWLHFQIADVRIDVGPLLGKMVGLLLVPLLIGRALQQYKPLKVAILRRYRLYFKIVQSIVLLVVPWTSISASSPRLQQLTGERFGLLVACAAVFTLFLMCFSTGAIWFFPAAREVKKAFVVSVSMKTVSIPIVIISLLPADVGDKGLMSLVQVVCFVVMLLGNSMLAPRLRFLIPSGEDLPGGEGAASSSSSAAAAFLPVGGGGGGGPLLTQSSMRSTASGSSSSTSRGGTGTGATSRFIMGSTSSGTTSGPDDAEDGDGALSRGAPLLGDSDGNTGTGSGTADGGLFGRPVDGGGRLDESLLSPSPLRHGDGQGEGEGEGDDDADSSGVRLEAYDGM